MNEGNVTGDEEKKGSAEFSKYLFKIIQLTKVSNYVK